MLYAIIPLLIVGAIVCVDFIYYLIKGRRLRLAKVIYIIDVWVVVLVPVFFLADFDWNQVNDCCTDSAVFSPEHRTGIYGLIMLCTAAYFYSGYRKSIAPPLAEVLVNSLLIVGIAINILLCMHMNTKDLGALAWAPGNIPIILLFILALARNQQLLVSHLFSEPRESGHLPARWAEKLLRAGPFIKFPLLLVLSLPLLLVISLVLFVFGQKPDTLVRAFTDTYKHGFSQLDYMCDNVACGGHYLCSVAAKGHKQIVKPVRLGERNGHPIICNRQLLIANAFEELIQDKAPAVHRIVRKHYNKVGSTIHRYYAVFNNRYIADLVYVCMKPLEWLFLCILYTLDKKPENRIAKQYVSKTDKLILEAASSRLIPFPL